jgi:hypothetical protein
MLGCVSTPRSTCPGAGVLQSGKYRRYLTNVTSHESRGLAFEASYPPKPEGHKDLLDIDFNGVFAEALGEESFARIFHDVDEKLCEVIEKDDFSDYFEAGRSCFSTSPLLNSELESRRHEEAINDIIHIQSFREAYRAAVTFDVVRWMFKERQDILATFVHKICVPGEMVNPRVIRITNN